MLVLAIAITTSAVSNADREASDPASILAQAAQKSLPRGTSSDVDEPWNAIIQGLSARVDPQARERLVGLRGADYARLQRERLATDVSRDLPRAYSIGLQFLLLAEGAYYEAYRDALSIFGACLKVSPNFGRALYGRGRAYYSLTLDDLASRGQVKTAPTGLPIFRADDRAAGLLDRALGEFRRAVAVEPAVRQTTEISKFTEMTQVKLSDYWIRKGYEKETANRFSDALALYDKALAADPESFSAGFNKGNVLVALSRFREAINSYDRILRGRPMSGEALWAREATRLRLNGIPWPDGPRAIQALKIDVQSPDQRVRLGAALLLILLMRSGGADGSLAEQALSDAIGKNPRLEDEIQKIEGPRQ